MNDQLSKVAKTHWDVMMISRWWGKNCGAEVATYYPVISLKEKPLILTAN
jgi:hypothetical protein